MNRNLYLLMAICCLLLFTSSPSFGQTISNNLAISSQTMPSLNVCSGQGTFVVRVSNITASPITSVTFRDSLPTGINYVSGSVSGTGTTMGSIISPNVVTFNIASIPANGFVDISFAARATCAAPTVATNVVNTYRASWSTFTTTPFITSSYGLSFPSLSVNVTNNASFSGACYSRFVRTIVITNGGTGPVDSIMVTDVNGSGLTVNNMSPGTFTSLSASNGRLVLKAAQFATVGNSDNKLDQNESITVYDTVTMTGTSNFSGTITANWSCSGSNCTNGTTNNQFSVNASINTTATPTLIRTLYVDSPPDSVGFFDRVTVLREVIRNTSTVTAYNVQVILYAPGARYFDTSALRKQYNQGSLSKPAYVVLRNLNQNVNLGTQTLEPSLLPHGMQPSYMTVQLDTIPAGDSVTLHMIVRAETLTRVAGNLSSFILSTTRDQNLTWTGCPAGSFSMSVGDFPEKYYSGISSTPVAKAPAPYAQAMDLCSTFSMTDSTNLNGSRCAYYNGDTINLTLSAGVLVLPVFTDKSKFMIRLKMQPGLQWDGDISKVKAVINTSTTPWPASSVVDNIAVDSTLQIYFKRSDCPNANFGAVNIYQNYFRLSLRLINTCTGSAETIKGIRMTRYFDIDTTVSYPVEAGPASGWPLAINSSCPVACTEGVSILRASNERTTLGRPDNNNDGIADPGGSINMNRVALNTITWGDTLAMKMRMVVHTAQAGGVPYLYLKSILFANNTDSTLGATGNSYLLKAPPSVTIRTTGGSIYIGTATGATTVGNSFTTNLSLQDGGLSIPGYTAYQEGDTVDIVQNVVYYKKGISNTIAPLPITLSNKPYTSLVANPTTAQQFRCDSTACNINLYGMGQYVYNLPGITANACADSTTLDFTLGVNGGLTGNQYVNCGGASPFPYELRNVAYPSMLKIAIPASSGYTFSRMRLVWYFNQPNCVTINFGALPASDYSFNGDTILLNFRTILANHGYDIDTFNRINLTQLFTISLDMKKAIGTACNIDHVSQDAVLSTVAYIATTRPTEDWIPVTGSPTTQNLTTGLNAPQATNSFTTTITTPVITATSQQLPVDINIATGSTGIAPFNSNHWLGVGLKPGLSIDSVVDLSTNAILPTVAGSNIYQIGTLGASTINNYRIYLRISGCNNDSLWIYADRTPCSGYPSSLDAYTCRHYADSVKFRYVTFAGELQLTSSLTSSQKDICVADTLLMQVTNTQSPAAKTIKLAMTIPNGINFIPGTAEMKRGNGPWSSATDPVAGTGNNFSWQMPITDTLAGSAFAPDNALQYRVAFMTNCSYISGSQINTKVEGTVACGPITSIYNSNPAPLAINGTESNYVAHMNASAQPITGCDIAGMGYPFHINSIFTGTVGSVTGTADSIIVALPPDYNFTSYTSAASGSHNAPTGQPAVQNGSGGSTLLAFPVAAGIAMGDSITFTFMYNEHSTAVNKCATSPTQNVGVNVYSARSLFCAATGTNCTGVKVSIGSDTVMLVSNKPSLSANITSAVYNNYNCGAFCSNPDSLFISGSIMNSGSADLPVATPAYMEMFMDLDSSGTVTTGDIQFHTFTFTGGLTIGQSINFSYTDTVISNCTNCDDKPIIARFSNNPAGGSNQCLCDSVLVQPFPVTLMNIPLPVKFGSVNVQMADCDAYITFETYSEDNNILFYIDRSKDGRDWYMLGMLPGKGSPSTGASYDFIDQTPLAGNSFYRIREVDADGRFTFSKIAVLDNNCKDDGDVMVYPNPASNGFYVLVPDGYKQTATVKLFNQLGQEMSIGVVRSAGNLQVNTSKLSSGVYILKVMNAGHLIHVQSLTINN